MAANPHDDPAIQAGDVIIRRVNPVHHVVPGEDGVQRISSKLFSPSSGPGGGMSVDMLKLIQSAGIDARAYVSTPTYTGSVCFTAGDVRGVGLRVGYDPIKGIAGVKDNEYHGEVWGGEATPNKFSNAQRRALQQASTWFVQLHGVEIN